MKVYFVSSQPKQYLYNHLTQSGINIVHNKELDALRNCLRKKNSEKSVEGFFVVLNETPVNKNKHWGLVNLEVVSHYNSNKRNLAPEWIRCAIWREGEDIGTFFDVILKKFGKNKKREHYTDMRKICTQILDECKKFADGTHDSGLYEAKNMLRDLLTNRGRRCE
jgi:hypothetical protein